MGTSRAVTRLRSALLALAGLLTAGPAVAHPHVWITARAELVFSPDGKVSGVRHAWTFDEAYSAFITQGLDKDGDGKLTSEELAPLAEENTKNLEEFGYFTRLKVAGRAAEFEAPREPRMIVSGGRATLGFLLPLKSAVAPGRGAVSLEVYDPTFFVDFALAEGDEAARLAGAPAGCKATVTRAKGPAQAGGEPLSEAFFAALTAADSLKFANRVLVACP